MTEKYFKLGISGYPLGHSLSPQMQMAALKSMNLDGEYNKYEVEPEKLSEQIQYFKDNDFTGFNVTIPYKTAILQYLDIIDEKALKINAVNTVKIDKNKKLHGYNTDIYGFLKSLPNDFQPETAYILGCGGAAKSVVTALDELNTKDIVICARQEQKAIDFISQFKQKLNTKMSFLNINTLNNIEEADILVNATPLGTLGDNQTLSPVNENIFKTAKKTLLVYDLVYNPSETEFIKQAKRYSLQTINGIDMLTFQGTKAFEIWTDMAAPDDTMRQAVMKQL